MKEKIAYDPHNSTFGDRHERDFEWEANGWDLSNTPDDLIYSLWTVDGVLYLADTSDLIESIDIKTREQADELIARLIRARDDVFPAAETKP